MASPRLSIAGHEAEDIEDLDEECWSAELPSLPDPMTWMTRSHPPCAEKGRRDGWEEILVRIERVPQRA
jgi:hypothetical protein